MARWAGARCQEPGASGCQVGARCRVQSIVPVPLIEPRETDYMRHAGSKHQVGLFAE